MPGTDERDLRSALRTIREAVPTALLADFQTSDQDSYGFTLERVTLADGAQLDTEAFEALADDVNDHLMNISWNGVMKEARGGAVTLEVPATFDDGQAAADEYMDDLLGLLDAFNYELCEICHNDVNKHTFGPDPLGKPHAFCIEEN